MGILLSFAALVFVAFPIRITAFWPFAETQAAHHAPVPDSGIRLLEAASNPDPNPLKGGLSIAVTDETALLPARGPAAAYSSVSVSSSAGGSDAIFIYEVREGDSLSEIADMFEVSVNTILWANEIKDASTIRPGSKLLILPVSGVAHTVKKGDTLASIAKRYDADAGEVALYNGLSEDAALAQGDELIIPGGNLATPSPKKSSTSKGSTLSKALPAVSGYFSNPVPGARLTQGLHGNNGIDFGNACGTSVYASASGTVIVAKGGGGYNGGYGNYIVISHANGTQTLYAHLTSLSVSGGTVAAGDLIGTIGNTGRSTGCHLHFEVRGAKNPFAG